MLIDHAPAVKRSRTNIKRKNRQRSRKKILLLLPVLIIVLILLTFSCFNILPSHEQKSDGVLSVETSEPETNEPVEEEIFKSSVETKTLTVSQGDTLAKLLEEGGVAKALTHRIIDSLKDVFNPRNLRKGQKITLAFENMDAQAEPVFKRLSIRLDVTNEVCVNRMSDNSFKSEEIIHELDAVLSKSRAEISSSLYNAAEKAGMPIDILVKLINAYSYDVDFQRDIRPGDKFEALYEKMLDEDGNFVRGGSILYASLTTKGRTIPVYRFKTSDGIYNLYNEDGQSIRKTLMVTPIDGARLSSGYGMRKHPILGYSRMHKGLDFAASKGTPIMAAGDGVVEYAGKKGSYGNYICLHHANEYKTVYGHLSKYGRGIKKGVKVKQGQIIGYVGSTGVSTGPHLHYEVIHRSKNINPGSIKTPPGKTLKGEELEKFFLAKRELMDRYASLEDPKKLASRE